MYCTLDDIRNVIAEKDLVNLTNDFHRLPPPCGAGATAGKQSAPPPYGRENGIPANKVNEDLFESVSSDADSLINGYLRAKYKLPLKNVPKFIKTIATDICAYRLYSRRPQEIPKHIVNNFELAIKQLEDVKKGNLLLETPSEDEETGVSKPKSGFRCSKTKKDKIFTDKLMKNYRTL